MDEGVGAVDPVHEGRVAHEVSLDLALVEYAQGFLEVY